MACQIVGGGDEKDLGEIVVDVEIVVVEGDVLLRVEHLEQGGGGIAPKIHRHLVDFVEAEDRVGDPDLLHRLDNLAGHGPDIGPAVATDLRLVTDPPRERRANFLPIARAIDLQIEVLPTPGGPTRQRIGPLIFLTWA
jgi:hypothetical protein